MARWFSRRWVWAALAGTTVAVGLLAGRADGEGPPKVGAVISLNIDGKGERQFKVIKSDRQPDGTYLSELKDTKTGETITLVDKPDEAPSGPKAPEPSKNPAPPKAKAPAPPPPMPDSAKDAPKDKEKEKRPLLGRIFGDRDKDKDKDKDKMPAAPATAVDVPTEPTGKKPGLFSRVFGPKKPTGPGMPAASSAGGPVVKPSPSTPPAVIPTPPGGVTAPPGLPPFPVTGGTPSSTAEPPRVMPAKPAPTVPPMPVTPPVPTVPAPLPPATAPSFPTPAPLPVPMPSTPTPVPAVPVPMPTAPAFPAPTVPAPLPAPPIPVPMVPAAPGGSGIPPIPVPPGGTSAAKPIQVVVPAGFIPAGVAFDRDVQPFVIALQTMDAPSARLTAAKGLAEGRHASSEGVKSVLFQAARMDPCAEVRAACIEHLCKLGYFNAYFLGFIQTACEDGNPMVRDAAKTACAKMIRQK